MDTAIGTDMKEKKGITGSTIKMIAIIAMLIDHTAATILDRIIQQQGLNMIQDIGQPIVIVDLVMRLIGRLGFPIFIFLLIEGLEHTRNKWKYLLRMVIFALVSEIPFDFAFNLTKEDICAGRIIEFSYQNVYFTLAIGLLTIIGIKLISETKLPPVGKVFANIGLTMAGMGLAFLLQTDYAGMGVLAIVVTYLLRNKRVLSSAMTCVVLTFASVMEVTAFAILPFISNYNGKRGWKLKWVFYIFYPAHLFVLWLICLAMGIA